jgi:hypothetical protein
MYVKIISSSLEVVLHYYKLLQINFVTADILYARFNLFNDLSVFYISFVDASNPLKMVNIDRIRSELWQTVCKKYNFNTSAFVVLIMWTV